MKVAIIDDELWFCNKLKKMLEEEVTECVFDIIHENFNQILNKSYDLIIVDIILGDGDGIALAKKYQKVYPFCLLIFISNTDGLVFKALRLNMFYFIRKSYLDIDFKECINKLIKVKRQEELTITIMVERVPVTIAMKDIIYIQSGKNNCYIYLEGQEYKTHNSMAQVYDELDPTMFCKINKQEIVNLQYVEYIKDGVVYMTSILKFKVSRRLENVIKNKYYTYKLDNS